MGGYVYIKSIPISGNWSAIIFFDNKKGFGNKTIRSCFIKYHAFLYYIWCRCIGIVGIAIYINNIVLI